MHEVKIYILDDIFSGPSIDSGHYFLLVSGSTLKGFKRISVGFRRFLVPSGVFESLQSFSYIIIIKIALVYPFRKSL